MGFARPSHAALAVCLLVATFSSAAPAADTPNTNAVRARGAARPGPAGDGRTEAALGLPPGSQELRLDDGSSEFSVGVIDQQGTVGAQAVYLNCFMPPAEQLPLTIDTVSILFPTSDQYGETGLFAHQTFQILVYVDPDSTGDPRDAELVQRTTFDLEPSNTVFQNVTLDEPVTVSAGTVYVGFTDPYVAVAHEPIYPAALDTDTLSNLSYAYHNLEVGSDFDGQDLSAATNGGSIVPGTFLIRALYTTGGSVRICWDPGQGDNAPPANNRVCTSSSGRKCGECADDDVARGGLTGFNVYRGTSPGVQPTPANLFASVPANTTTVGAGVAPSGSFFVVTGVYGSNESGPSNEVGVKPATIASVKVKSTKLVAKGRDFTASVTVTVDGIPFAQRATVKAGTKVTQKGALVTGESVAAYIAAHGGSARISFQNANGTLATFTARR